MKRCSICRSTKPLSDFAMKRGRKDNRTSACKNCLSVAQRLRWYNLSTDQFNALLALQDNKCKICLTDLLNEKRIAIDHDHSCCPGKKTCGKCIRGLLCYSCNSMIGQAKDSIQILQSAVKYLQAGKATL